MLSKEFITACTDQVLASVRDHNRDDLQITVINTQRGFKVFHHENLIATVIFIGSQPAIKVDAEYLKSSCMMIGDDAAMVAGELIVLLVGDYETAR